MTECTPVTFSTAEEKIRQRKFANSFFFFCRTGELLGCVTVDLSVTRMNAGLKKVKPTKDAILAIVDGETGALVGNSEDQGVLVSDFLVLSDLGIPYTELILESFRKTVNKTLTEGWTANSKEDPFFPEVFKCDHGIIAAYPVPVPPVEYDPNYRPQHLVLQLSANSIFTPIVDFEDSIDGEIRNVASMTIGIGVLGLIVTLAFVWCVAKMFTQPLRWIESISKRIVNHSDKTSGVILDEKFESSHWAPNTEIMDLVAAFQKMIEGFSGERPPTVAEVDYSEIKNSITWQSDFCQLYEKGLDAMKSARSNTSAATPQTEEESRELPSAKDDEELGRKLVTTRTVESGDGPLWQSEFSSSFKRNGEVRQGRQLSFVAGRREALDMSDERKSIAVVPAPPKQNLGRNIPVSGLDEEKSDTGGWLWFTRSRLFRWILLFLVTPLVLATTAICVRVTINIVSTVPDWVITLADESLEIAKDDLASVARLKGRLIEEMLIEPIRDLHSLSRVANWIHSGAIRRTNSFTEVDQATEECKTYGSYECPLFSEDPKTYRV